MGELDGVDADDLREALAALDEGKATLRLAVGIAYLNGVGPTELAAWFGVSRSTVYGWLGRLEGLADGPPGEVLDDADRPGRPPKLAPTERERLADTLGGSPDSAGYDAHAWTPELVQRHVRSAFGVEYSRRHVRDLLHDMGFAPDADGEWRERA